MATTNQQETQTGWSGWLMLGLLALAMLALGLYLGGVAESPQQATKQPEEMAALQIQRPQSVQVEAEPDKGNADASIKQTQTLPVETSRPPAKTTKSRKPKPAKRVQKTKRLAELPAGFVDNLPTLNIDIHSYDERAAKRYVFVNMSKYREGDYLTEGPKLLVITANGIELEYLGERFSLPIGNH